MQGHWGALFLMSEVPQCMETSLSKSRAAAVDASRALDSSVLSLILSIGIGIQNRGTSLIKNTHPLRTTIGP